MEAQAPPSSLARSTGAVAATGRPSSVTTAIHLLKAFTQDDRELGISELAKRLGVAKSTAHRLASTLLAEGLLEQNPETDRYRLGLTLFSLGAMVRSRLSVAAVARPVLTALRGETQENVRLAVLDGAQIVFVYDFESPHHVRLRSNTGLSAPAFCTAEGMVLLGDRPSVEIERIVRGELTPRTQKTITDPSAIRARIEAVQLQGYAVDDEESQIGVRSIAAPVRGPDGHLVAAVSIAGPRTRVRKSNFLAVAAKAVEAAQTISARLGNV